MTTLAAHQQQRGEEQYLVGLELSRHSYVQAGPTGLRYRCRDKVTCAEPSASRGGASSQQSSVSRRVGTPASQAGAACVPSSQLPTAPGRLTTVHRSRDRVLLHQLHHFLLEHLSTLRVIAEHVEARARRRQQHHAACPRAPARTRAAPPPPASPPLRQAPRLRALARISGVASPIATTVASRDRSGSRSSVKSPLLKRPPMITTSPRSKLSIARCAASTFVAFESLTNRTPSTTATGSSACSRPVNDSTARTIASCDTPAICATVAAAITSATRCRPINRIDDSGTSGVSTEKKHLPRARRRAPAPASADRRR